MHNMIHCRSLPLCPFVMRFLLLGESLALVANLVSGGAKYSTQEGSVIVAGRVLEWWFSIVSMVVFYHLHL